MKTTEAPMSSAEICRRQSWLVGSILLSTGYPHGETRIRITAIGRNSILAEPVAVRGVIVDGGCEEQIYDLHHRDWERVA